MNMADDNEHLAQAVRLLMEALSHAAAAGVPPEVFRQLNDAENAVARVYTVRTGYDLEAEILEAEGAHPVAPADGEGRRRLLDLAVRRRRRWPLRISRQCRW